MIHETCPQVSTCPSIHFTELRMVFYFSKQDSLLIEFLHDYWDKNASNSNEALLSLFSVIFFYISDIVMMIFPCHRSSVSEAGCDNIHSRTFLTIFILY